LGNSKGCIIKLPRPEAQGKVGRGVNESLNVVLSWDLMPYLSFRK